MSRTRGEAQDLKLQISVSGMRAVNFMVLRILCKVVALGISEAEMEQELGGKR